MRALQSRYHAELLWQDKYRALSLYGTWTLILVNSLFFVGSTVLRSRSNQCLTRVIVQTVPVRFDTISEQKRDETKPTRPLTASECPLLVETPVRPAFIFSISFSTTLLWPRSAAWS